MKALAWIIVALGLMQGGWLAFDGSRALIVGDYVTPSSGQYAGQASALIDQPIQVDSHGMPPRVSLHVRCFRVLSGFDRAGARPGDVSDQCQRGTGGRTEFAIDSSAARKSDAL